LNAFEKGGRRVEKPPEQSLVDLRKPLVFGPVSLFVALREVAVGVPRV
jgi:hypothetical protein